MFRNYHFILSEMITTDIFIEKILELIIHSDLYYSIIVTSQRSKKQLFGFKTLWMIWSDWYLTYRYTHTFNHEKCIASA